MTTLLRRSALASLALVAALPCAAASGAEQHAHGNGTIEVKGLDSLVSTKLTAGSAVARDCVARPATGRAGVATSRYRSAGDGVVTFRLAGTGDWDLAVFDSAKNLVGSSAAFGANEVAQVGVREGTELLVQACRRKGRATSATLTTQLARVDWQPILAHKQKLSLVRVKVSSGEQIEMLERRGFDVTHDVSEDGANVLLYGAEDLAKLEKTGLSFTTVIGDLGSRSRAERAEQEQWAASVGRSALPTGRTGYRVLEDYQRELKELAEKNSSIVRPFNLPEKSFQGRDIQAIEIAENVQNGDDGRPVLFINGIHHAREWPAAEASMEFAHELVKGYGKDPRITKIMRDVRVVVQPFTNPDGFQVSRSTVNDPEPDGQYGGAYQTTTTVVVFGGSLSYKRKNCNPLVPAGASFPCPLAIGVDPNRNYAEGWGGPGASSNPNDQGYRGADVNSEPETRAVQKFSSQSNTTVLLSMHNVAAKVLRPPGLKKDGMAPDEEGLKGLGLKIAAAAGYTNEYGYQLYETTGTTKDWVYAALGVYGYTIELGPSNGDFHGNYKVHVVDQYEGSGRTKGKGLREGLLASAEWTRDTTQISRIAGRSVPGRTLRITKKFQTDTSPICLIVDPTPVNDICAVPGAVKKVDEKVDFTMTVPANGKFEWFVNPSTRPFVAKKGGREVYTLTCEDNGKVIESREVYVARGDIARLGDLPCGGTIPSDAAPSAPGAAPPAAGTPVVPPAGGPRGEAPSTKAAGARVRVLSSKRSGKRARFVVEVTGGAVRKAVVTLLDRRGKKLGTARVSSLSGKRTITIKTRRSLKRGAYRLRFTGTGLASAVTSAARLK